MTSLTRFYGKSLSLPEHWVAYLQVVPSQQSRPFFSALQSWITDVGRCTRGFFLRFHRSPKDLIHGSLQPTQRVQTRRDLLVDFDRSPTTFVHAIVAAASHTILIQTRRNNIQDTHTIDHLLHALQYFQATNPPNPTHFFRFYTPVIRSLAVLSNQGWTGQIRSRAINILLQWQTRNIQNPAFSPNESAFLRQRKPEVDKDSQGPLKIPVSAIHPAALVSTTYSLVAPWAFANILHDKRDANKYEAILFLLGRPDVLVNTAKTDVAQLGINDILLVLLHAQFLTQEDRQIIFQTIQQF
ncbi:hypothetical protein BLNAU_9814 [Blattamonas nauphoetae]|uniref:Uncharacterized protein n=1 Tax=Blattamonas nauphoetae TaxID=2049346 RepID=A0ABQ9XUV1_9EUKA|nr:hypothetical protein BLNAU_9814 [Blattamonas nauphoetae]